VARWRASRIWLRKPGRAHALLHSASRGDGTSLSLRAWLALTYARDERAAELAAREALAYSGGDTRFASAALAEVLLRRREHDAAIEVIDAAGRRAGAAAWYALTLADALVEAGRTGEAEELLEDAATTPRLRRHALKRLSRQALERGDRDRARRFFTELLELAPDYLVYASDYEILGGLQLEAGDRDGAHETWRRGAGIYSRHRGLRERLRTELGEDRPLSAPRIAPVAEEAVGARRIPVRTPFINWRVDLGRVIDEVTAELRHPGDVIALSESAAAASQGRVLPLELVRPGVVARLLSRFVGKRGPLHSPEGMQGAVMEAGRVRVVLGAVAGALGKAVGRRGWFYRSAGPRTAMIDDVAACLPPHDHHLIFAPSDPDDLADGLSRRLGCGVAIVDANHLSGAWIVGASPGVDRDWLARALEDNPAGNEDEQTPVVVVRPIGSAGDRPQPRADDAAVPAAGTQAAP
jgi:tetratricopeptide (TPR) repeat protein